MVQEWEVFSRKGGRCMRVLAGVGQDFVSFSRKCHRGMFVSVGSGLGKGGGVRRKGGKSVMVSAGSGVTF